MKEKTKKISKTKETKPKKEVIEIKDNKSKILLYSLVISVFLLCIISILLYLNGITRMLPIVFFLVLPVILTLFIFLLSKNVWVSSLKRKRKPVIKINA